MGSRVRPGDIAKNDNGFPARDDAHGTISRVSGVSDRGKENGADLESYCPSIGVGKKWHR